MDDLERLGLELPKVIYKDNSTYWLYIDWTRGGKNRLTYRNQLTVLCEVAGYTELEARQKMLNLLKEIDSIQPRTSY